MGRQLDSCLDNDGLCATIKRERERERVTRRKPMAVNRLLCPRHKRAIQPGVLLTQSLGQNAEDAAEQIGRVMQPSSLKKTKPKSKHASLWLRLNQRKCFRPPLCALGVMILSSSLWLWLSFRENNTHNNSSPFNDKVRYGNKGKSWKRYGNEEVWTT